MKRTLLTAGAVLILAAPAIAQTSTVIEKKTITKESPETGTTVSKVIIAPNPRPAPRAETPPPAPGPRVVWTPGHWSWNPDTHAYAWLTGKYLAPPREHAAWVPGRWQHRGDGWMWEEGRWD